MGCDRRSIRWYILVVLTFMNISCMKKNESIKVLLSNRINTEPLDPSNLALSDQYMAMDNLLIKLLELNKGNDYSHLLAEKIEVSNNNTDFEITLAKSKFSDGSLIEANDVVNSFKRVIIKGSSHVPLKDLVIGADNLKSIEDSIEGLKSEGTAKVRIKLKKPTKEFFYYLTMADMGILHKSQYTSDKMSNDKFKITSGAYRLEDGKLVRNDDYIEFNNNSPLLVEFVNPPSIGSTKDFNGYDLGTSSFIDKESGASTTLQSPYRYITSTYNMLCYIVLNTNSELFKNINNRQFINRKIIEKLESPTSNPFFKKATQFFLPDSFAFQKKFDHRDSLKDNLQPNEALEKGFRILATKGTKKYTFSSLEKKLQDILGIKVEISFSDEIERYSERKKKRDFDAYLVPTSMSYGVVTESLNILYKAPVRFGNNPSNKIIELIDQYQSNLQKNENVIEEITKEMTRESEIIPLFYVSSPYFYNSDRIDISQMNVNESLKFWKMNVK